MSINQKLQEALELSLAQQTRSEVRLSDLVLIAGGSSQETWRLDLWVAEGTWQGNHKLILRRPLGGAIFQQALDLQREFSTITAAVAGGVPSPKPYWLLENLLGYPATLVERLEGESIGRKIAKEPYFAEARRQLPRQMGEAIAAIHQVDLTAHRLAEILPGLVTGQTPAQTRRAQIEAELEYIGEPHPVLELGLRWLHQNEPPPPDQIVLVHGDYRVGNVLVNQRGLVAVIDWEFAHVGDYAEDLTYPLVREWRFGFDHLHFGGIGSPEAFFEAYSQSTGRVVDPARIFYWELMGNVWWAIGMLKQVQRHLRGEQPNLEFASLGRRCAEMEFEILRLLKIADRKESVCKTAQPALS